jgi:hypothetical protein
MSYDLLETLQADVLAILQATPALADAVILSDNEGDIEAKVVRALAPLKSSAGGKNGLACVVLLPEITQSEANLPGPPVTVEIQIQTLENVLINRRAEGGTGLRSSQAALIVLNALHLHSLGGQSLYSDKDPITPVKVKAGHVSHAVLLKLRANGLQGPGKAAAVSVQMSEDTITLACATSGADIYSSTDGSYPDSTNGTLYTAPFAAPDVGTVVRAAAYKNDLNPGDVLEFRITD